LTSKTYLQIVAGLVLLAALPLMLFNLWQDDFGLFWSASPKRIWTLEKTSKYLMSYRYIPRNFDGLLVGPSFSDAWMDTKRLTGYRIYNLSMDAANSTELRAATVNAINRGHMRVLILCLSYYLTQDNGMKGPQINEKEYWGSLFSWLPFEVQQAKMQIRSGKLADAFAGSEWGMGNLFPRQTYTWDDFVRYQRTYGEALRLDPVGFRHLQDIIDAAHAHGVKVLAYFFPNTYWHMQTLSKGDAWREYRVRTLALFNDRVDVVWDMNNTIYEPLTRDAACYSDGHLSIAGARVVLADIQRHLNQSGMVANLPPLFAKTVTLACLGQPGAGSGYDRIPAATSAPN
jgi:hypothetical protein